MRSISTAALLVVLSGGAAAAPGDVHHVIDAATLRSGPGSQYPSVGTVSARRPVPLVERSRQGGWIETDRGWVWGQLVGSTGQKAAVPPARAADAPPVKLPMPEMARPEPEPTKPQPEAAPRPQRQRPSLDDSPNRPTGTASRGRMMITAHTADLRSGPSPDSRADLRLSRGAVVTTSTKDGEWIRIRFGDAQGWVKESQLGQLEPARPPEKPPEPTLREAATATSVEVVRGSKRQHSVGNWSVEREGKRVAASVGTANKVEFRNLEFTPRLLLVCENKKLTVSITLGREFPDVKDIPVRIQADLQPIQTHRVDVQKDRLRGQLPIEPIVFVREHLMGHQNFAVEFRPPEGTFTAIFDLQGVDSVVKTLIEACEVKLM